MIALLAIVLLVPTTAFAAYTLLADDIYGSFEQLKKKAVGMTMQGYLTFNAKLADAKGELGDQEYEKFKAAISSLASAKMTYGDTNGNINFEELPIEVVEELKATYIGLQPFFDRLNNLKSANEVLTESELEKYIAAEMTVETIAAKVGVPYVQSVKELPEEYQERYLEARNIMREVSEKQQLGYWKEELIND